VHGDRRAPDLFPGSYRWSVGMSFYSLPKNVHVCITDGDAIWFDGNKYYGTKKQDAAAIAAVVNGWPRVDQENSEQSVTTEAEVHEVAGDLVERGLLTRDATRGTGATPVALEKSERTLDDTVECRCRLQFNHVARFVLACLMTVIELQCISLAYALRSTAKRKCKGEGRQLWADWRAVELVTVFTRTRRYFYTARDACLFDSFVLVRFLAAYRVYPSLVLGVKTGPFGAHAWVQHSGSVWNSDADFVQRFTPIRVI
jgi:transglutaminase superfamily protein